MKLWVIGLDHHRAHLDLRVRASLEGQLNTLQSIERLSSYVLLSTCNRLEFYSVDEKRQMEFFEAWCDEAGVTAEEQSLFYRYQGEDALHHLMRVCGSLESMVLGENQIHGQVKKAYQEASDRGSLDPVLHRSFQTAFRVAKRVRSETEIGQFAVSIPSVGVRMAERIVGALQEKRVGIIGLGEIGRVAAEHFSSVLPKEVLLFNRTEEKAKHLARSLCAEGIKARASLDPKEILQTCEVIISTTPVSIFSEQELKENLGKRSSAFILDLAVPPSLPERVSDWAYLYRVDDLKKISEENNRLREQELLRAEQIIHSELKKNRSQIEALDLQETFQRLSEKVDEIRVSELTSLKIKLGDLSPEQWDEVEKTTRRLAQKILQDPMRELRTRLERDAEKESLIQFFRNLFKI